MKYYLNPNTNTVHIVGEGMWTPKREGTTNCGQQIKYLVPIVTTRALRKVDLNRVCNRCKQLTG